MVEEGILGGNSNIGLFTLHYIFQPQIQASLDEFKEGWNRHPVFTEKKQYPIPNVVNGNDGFKIKSTLRFTPFYKKMV